MKIIKYIFILCITAILICSSCEKKLNQEPTTFQDISEILSTPEGLTYLKNGMYAITRDLYGKYLIHFAEMLADTGEIIFQGTYQQFTDLQYKLLDPSFSWAEASWVLAYQAINNANLIIDNLNVIEDMDTKNMFKADARLIRGLVYFDLVRFFALPYGDNYQSSIAVPVITTGVDNPDDISYPSRSSVEQVFTLVEEDLLFAAINLPENENFYASRYAAQAILSRYYLTIENFSLAAAYSDSVIQSQLYSLHNEPFNAYNHNENSVEDIFTWQQNNLDNVGLDNSGLAAFYASTDAIGRSDFVIDDGLLYGVFDSTDLRGRIQTDVTESSKIKEMYYVGFGDNAGGIYTAKWLDYKTNITFIRLAEIYLNRAEANQYLLENSESITGTNTPLQDIKIIQGRAGVDTSLLVSVDMSVIRLERYKELIFEGHRLHDYKRWKRFVADIPYNSDQLIIPIPKWEFDIYEDL